MLQLARGFVILKAPPHRQSDDGSAKPMAESPSSPYPHRVVPLLPHDAWEQGRQVVWPRHGVKPSGQDSPTYCREGSGVEKTHHRYLFGPFVVHNFCTRTEKSRRQKTKKEILRPTLRQGNIFGRIDCLPIDRSGFVRFRRHVGCFSGKASRCFKLSCDVP